jgi:hypothetical protein
VSPGRSCVAELRIAPVFVLALPFPPALVLAPCSPLEFPSSSPAVAETQTGDSRLFPPKP